MTRYKYSALGVKQRQGADTFYLASCPAKSILNWADAPRKRADVRAGYQRELDKTRVTKVAEFLELSPRNILPSAVLISLRSGSFDVQEDKNGRVSLLIDVPELSATQARKRLADELFARMSESERELAKNFAAAEQVASEDALAENDDESEAVPPPSYFSALGAELAAYETLTEDRRKQLDEFALSLVKPGLILDGQHRVFGAKQFASSNVDIDIPIVVLPGLAWSEQVFHFYILNNTARPLDKRQLRSIISTSLSRSEIDDLYERFEQAGVDPEQAQWTYRANTDGESPFASLVNFGLRDEKAPLSDNVLDQVIGRFMKLPKRYSALTRNVDDWARSDYRLSLFYSFWRAVKDLYPDAWHVAASGDGQLFYKVCLVNLQEFVLERLKSALGFLPASPFSSPEALYDNVKTSLDRLPEQFFLREWRVKSLDTRDGHIFFLSQIREVIEADGKNLGNRKLFKATS